MSKQAVSIFALSVIATGVINKCRFVTAAVAQAGAAANTLGVARTDAAIGDVMTVDVLGTAVVEAGAAVAAGALVETDAQGRAITKAAGIAVGRVLPGQVAGAAGDFVEILLLPN